MWTAKTDQTGQADLRLRWAHRSFCWFCHAAAHFKFMHFSTKNWPFQGGTSVVVPYCSCCLCLYFGSSIMLVTYFVNFR